MGRVPAETGETCPQKTHWLARKSPRLDLCGVGAPLTLALAENQKPHLGSPHLDIAYASNGAAFCWFGFQLATSMVRPVGLTPIRSTAFPVPQQISALNLLVRSPTSGLRRMPLSFRKSQSWLVVIMDVSQTEWDPSKWVWGSFGLL